MKEFFHARKKLNKLRFFILEETALEEKKKKKNT